MLVIQELELHRQAKFWVSPHLDLWDLRANLDKVYEDAKDEPNDVTIVSSFCDQFLEKVSL